MKQGLRFTVSTAGGRRSASLPDQIDLTGV
jgi:hypothetical protein